MNRAPLGKPTIYKPRTSTLAPISIAAPCRGGPTSGPANNSSLSCAHAGGPNAPCAWVHGLENLSPVGLQCWNLKAQKQRCGNTYYKTDDDRLVRCAYAASTGECRAAGEPASCPLSSQHHQMANASGVLHEVLERAELRGRDEQTFLTKPDFNSMRHADDDTYDRQLWQWSPAAPLKYEHRSHLSRV